MRRAPIVAFALVASLLVVTAPPAAAANASGSLEVASKNTTTSDFNNATTLTNVSVANGNVSLSTRNIIEDWEDSDTTIDASSWSGWNGDTTHLSAQTGTVLNGSVTGEYQHDTNDGAVEIQRSSDITNNVTWATQIGSGITSGERTRYWFYQGSTRIGGVVFDGNGDVLWKKFGSSDVTIGSFKTGQSNEITVKFDFASDEADVVMNGTTIGTNLALSNSPSGWDTFEIGTSSSGSSWSSYTDNIKIRQRSDPPTGQYVSATHSAGDVQQGFTNLTLENASASVEWQYYDGSSWVVANSSTYTTSGNKTLAVSATADTWRVNVTFKNESGSPTTAKLHDEGLLFDAAAPSATLTNPSDGATLNDSSVTLKADINDSDFGLAQSDSVTVEFQTKDPNANSYTTEATKTLSSNGTAQTTITADIGGTWDWRVVATDSYGVSTTTAADSFTVPGNLTIYNETSPTNQITSVSVTGRFFGDEEIVVNETSTGVINLTGKPVNEPLILELEADGYHTRATLIESVYNQKRVYMLSTNETTVEVRFELQDRTGEFEPTDSRIAVQKPITRDRDGDGTNETEWETVAGDAFGVAGATFDLEKDQRYRIIVRNDQGDERVLGTYVADVSETVQLEVGQVAAVPADDDVEFQINATYIKNKNSQNTVIAEFNDSVSNTSTVYIEMFEKNNQSNVLHANETFDNGPYGAIAVTETVPKQYNETSWVVKITFTRNGETHQRRALVGPRRPVLPSLPGWVKAIISIGSIWMVAGLFSQLNGDVGAIATAGLGAMWWYVDFLPAEAGAGVVALSLVTAGIILIAERRGGGGL